MVTSFSYCEDEMNEYTLFRIMPDTKLSINVGYMGWIESEHCSVVSNSLQPHGLCSPWNSLGQNPRVCSLSLFQGIFPTQGWKPGILHCRRILYHLSHKGSPFLGLLRRKGNLPTCRSNPKYLYAHLYLPIRVCQTLLEGVKNDQRGTKGEK